MVEHILYCGDNVNVLRKWVKDETVDLVYLDPPFFTGKERRLRGRKQWRGEQLAFSDVWANHSAYLEWMRERLLEVRRVLKPSGSVFLHCDWHANHLLRVEMDQIFHPEQFRGEIIWFYRRWTSTARQFQHAHQTLLFYSKTDAYKFNTMHEDYAFSTNLDQIWQRRGRDEDGKAITVTDDNGEYLPLGQDKPGVPMRDVWEIPYLNPKARERVGYPTQKPIELLKRVILATTEPGDSVLDPFCGSGTTLVAAKLLGRNSIGIDTAMQAVAISQARLRDIHTKEGAEHNSPYRLGRFLTLAKNERIRALSKLLDMNIVHRNRHIDGFLKKNVGGSAIPVHYAGSALRPEVVEAFVTASKKRGCSLGLIIIDQATGEQTAKAQSLNSPDFRLSIVSYEELCKPNWRIEEIAHVAQGSLPIG